MKRTPKVYIEKEDEFEVKDVTTPKPVNLELENQWVLKDHTKPRDIKVVLPVSGGTWDHKALQNRNDSDQHSISAITNLQETLDSKLDAEDISLIYCGTSTEVVEWYKQEFNQNTTQLRTGTPRAALCRLRVKL